MVSFVRFDRVPTARRTTIEKFTEPREAVIAIAGAAINFADADRDRNVVFVKNGFNVEDEFGTVQVAFRLIFTETDTDT
ncbi:hypothetical protein PXH69_33855 [Rhodococcus qingshengii]|uniref:Uncharacterized protein n=1 Tax=Rhodococcus qingshengii TaxID=334542 RepID=A0AAW6LQP9_RHOSG|nr:hypothetical protein [Rhodococcus qingshengii]MDE8649952.1 hypothetical protein [Rhodococcus qingshengii]